MTTVLARGGFAEPWLARWDASANCWRQQYFTDLVREEALEFSRLRGPARFTSDQVG